MWHTFFVNLREKRVYASHVPDSKPKICMYILYTVVLVNPCQILEQGNHMPYAITICMFIDLVQGLFQLMYDTVQLHIIIPACKKGLVHVTMLEPCARTCFFLAILFRNTAKKCLYLVYIQFLASWYLLFPVNNFVFEYLSLLRRYTFCCVYITNIIINHNNVNKFYKFIQYIQKYWPSPVENNGFCFILLQ